MSKREYSPKLRRLIAGTVAYHLLVKLSNYEYSDLLMNAAYRTGSRHNQTTLAHLINMCKQIISNTTRWSLTKLNRHIGYIHGVMSAFGLVSVAEHRKEYKAIKRRVVRHWRAGKYRVDFANDIAKLPNKS